jgi:hypothetical protein
MNTNPIHNVTGPMGSSRSAPVSGAETSGNPTASFAERGSVTRSKLARTELLSFHDPHPALHLSAPGDGRAPNGPAWHVTTTLPRSFGPGARVYDPQRDGAQRWYGVSKTARAGLPAAGHRPALRSCGPRSIANLASRIAAFSLVEILVVVALLGVIILGLVAMFHQTQRALVGSTTQSDVLEAGRATAEFLKSDLEKITPCNSTNPNAWNFYSGLEYQNNGTPAVLVQPLLSPGDLRTNVMQSFFFVSCTNQHWMATGYVLDRPDLGVATLYRTNFDLTFGFTNRQGPPGVGIPTAGVLAIPIALTDFLNLTRVATANRTVPSNFSRIADGIVALRLRAYGINGVLVPLMNPLPHTWTNSLNLRSGFTMGTLNDPVTSSALFTGYGGDYDYAFNSNAVPAAVEIELGVLEPRSLTRFYGLTNSPSAALAWLQKTNRSGQVHIFRQRIPIRNVDPTAYQ